MQRPKKVSQGVLLVTEPFLTKRFLLNVLLNALYQTRFIKHSLLKRGSASFPSSLFTHPGWNLHAPH